MGGSLRGCGDVFEVEQYCAAFGAAEEVIGAAAPLKAAPFQIQPAGPPLDLFNLNEFRSRNGWSRASQMLRGAEVVEHRNLMHARDGAIRGAAFFGEVFAAHIIARIGRERNSRIPALLRAVVD